MGLETATKISELVATNPTPTDPKSQGDDHLRMIKAVLQNDAVAKTGPQTMEGPLTLGVAKAIRQQLGLSVTPGNNFTLDASADNGTMKLARGNAGATTQDIMTVDAAGKVAFPQNVVPVFNAVSNASQTLTTGVAAKILFQTEVFDSNNNFSGSTFTAPVAGDYFFEGQVLMGNATAALMQVQLRVNGSAVKQSRGAISASLALTLAVSGTVRLAAGDTVEVWAQQNTGANLNAITPDTVFSGFMVKAT